MKKILFLIGLVVSLLNINSVKALSKYEEHITTASGFTMTYEQYKKLSEMYDDVFIDNTKSDFLKTITSENTIFLGKEEKYIVTDYILDKNGNILSAFDREVSKEVANQVNIENKISTYGNTGNPSHSTASKYIAISRYYDGNRNQYVAQLSLDWLTTPIVKSYDVMAIRWTAGNIGITDAWGEQVCEKYQMYSFNGSNMVNKSNGIGISMNLFDNGSTPKLALYIYSNKNGGTYYGTYQHAVRSVTLAQSKSYTFSSSGLGGVLNYSDSIGSYYDNMQGVSI